MKRHRDRGSLQSIPVGRGHPQRGRRAIRVGDRAGTAALDGAALALLSDVLIGDRPWTMAELRGLIWMRELAERGRWRSNGLDDDEASLG